MGRLLGLVLVVAAVWVAAELYTRGFDHAFGGIFAGVDDPAVPLDQLHTGGGRDGKAIRARAREDDDDILVIEDEDPFEPKRTPIQHMGAHVQERIDASYQRRYGDR